MITYHYLKGDMNIYNQGLVDKYGLLMCVMPTTVMIPNAQTLYYMYLQKVGYCKGLWFKFVRRSLERTSLLAMRGNEEGYRQCGKRQGSGLSLDLPPAPRGPRR